MMARTVKTARVLASQAYAKLEDHIAQHECSLLPRSRSDLPLLDF
jgi:hypothetical protein